MTERIECLEMRAFLGVPDELAIDLAGGRSLLVFGDNATGKSTIADAIEWYLAGRVEYLTKENRASGLRSAASDPGGETSVAVQTTGELGGRVTLDVGPGADVTRAAAREHYLLRHLRDRASSLAGTSRPHRSEGPVAHLPVSAPRPATVERTSRQTSGERSSASCHEPDAGAEAA